MPETAQMPAIRPGLLDWMPVLSLIVVLAGVLLVAGGMIREVEDHTRRLEQLDGLAERLTRIEAKVDMLIERERRREERR